MRELLLLVVGVVAATFILVVSASPASAGGGPYGSTSTTQPDGTEVACSIAQSSGTSGSPVDGSVVGIESGADVEIFFGGTSVGDFTAGATAEGEATTSVDFSFTVPDVEPGTYPVVAAGAGFNVTCSLPNGADGFGVLAGGLTPAEQGGSGTTPDRDGALAFTGGNIFLMVLAAVILVVVGYLLKRRYDRGDGGREPAYRPW